MRILILFNSNNFAEHASKQRLFQEFKKNADKEGVVDKFGDDWFKLNNGDLLEVKSFQMMQQNKGRYKYDEVYVPASSYELFKDFTSTIIRGHHYNKDECVKQFSYVNDKLITL